MQKAKVYFRTCFSKVDVLQKLGQYTTRIFLVVIWCAVLWAFLGEDALPRQYVEYLRDRNPKPCIVSAVDIPSSERERLLNFLPPSWNDSLSKGSYQVLSTSQNNDHDNSSYQVLLVRQSKMCQNVLDFKGFTVLFPPVSNTDEASGSGESDDSVSTEFLSTGSIDVLSVLYPDTATTLLDIPVGHFFALALLLVTSSISGAIARWIHLPPLVGMIIAGFVLRNVPGIDFARHISNIWSSTLRNIALVVILIRGGFSMDVKQLKRLKLAVLLLAFMPCVVEGAVDGTLATFWLKLPWQFAFTLGYVIAAISPAIVVPATLNLQRQGYGQESGIPTLIVAAASMDVVISISIFGVFLGLSFSEGNLVLDIFRAPIQIIAGLLYGTIFGLTLWVLPTKHFKRGSKLRNRFFMTLGLGLFSLFGSNRAIIGGSNLAGSGALGVLVMAFMASQGWDSEEKELVSGVFLIVWQFMEPLLFGLIGAAVDLKSISPSLVGQGVGLIVTGLILRLSISFIVVLGNGFNWLEMCFVSVAWLPKATVQAAIGSLALDLARVRNDNREDAMEVELGKEILAVAVLAILLTAPLGALATSLLGPVLLKKPDNKIQSGSKILHADDENKDKELTPPLTISIPSEDHSTKVDAIIIPDSNDNMELREVAIQELNSEPES